VRLKELEGIDPLPRYPREMRYLTLYPETVADAKIIQQLLADAAELNLVSIVDQKHALAFPAHLCFYNPIQFAAIVEQLPDE